MVDLKKLRKEIDIHKIISFDIFDTLIVRDVLEPVDIFEVVSYFYSKKYGEHGIEDFKNVRVRAERLVREKRNAEVSLDEIYAEIGSTTEERERYKALELEVEEKFAVASVSMKEIYQYAQHTGKEIIIISDMYLPKSFIEKILSKCGYSGYAELFVSCEIGKRKKTGELYEHVLSRMNCARSDILHVGDNRKSDYVQAKKHGMHAYQIEKERKLLYHYRKDKFSYSAIQNNVFVSHVYNRCQMFSDAEYIGYVILGLPIFSFCKWLHEATLGVHKYFLARDGYLLQKAYEKMFPEEKSFCHYLYISRNALRRPNICAGISYEEMVEQLSGLANYDCAKILEFCCVNEENASILREQFGGLPSVKSRSELIGDVQYKKLFENIQRLEKKQYEEQYNNLVLYLKQEGFSGQVAVVDVGWRGTAQINLERICSGSADITGYYFGLEDAVSSNNYERSKMKGFFWEWTQKSNVAKCILNGRKAIFESMFLSKEGSTIGYDCDENNISRPNCERGQKNATNCISEDIQRGAMTFIDEFIHIEKYLPEFESKDVASGLVDFMLYPQKRDMVIGDVEFENHRETSIASPKLFKCYLHKPKTFLVDFKNAEWKLGFLRRLFPLERGTMKILNYLYESMRHK